MRVSEAHIIRAPHRWKTRLYVVLKTDTGRVGIGESTLGQVSKSVQGALYDFRQQIIGMNVHDIAAFRLYVERDVYADGGQIGRAALAGYETALWDLIGQDAGQPLFRLLGGAVHGEMLAYANGWYRGDRDPEAYAKNAQETVALGFKALKIDPFGVSWKELSRGERELSFDILNAVRKAAGPDVRLIVEGHSRFEPQTAIEIARRLEPLNIAWFEEPVPYSDLNGYRSVISRSPVPIATGESLWRLDQYVQLMTEAKPAIVQFDPIHVGGISASRAICDLAMSQNCLIAPHSASGPVNEAVCAHLAATVPHLALFETFPRIGQLEPADEMIASPVRFNEGSIRLEDCMGIGCNANVEGLLKLHSEQEFRDQNLFARSWERRNTNA